MKILKHVVFILGVATLAGCMASGPKPDGGIGGTGAPEVMQMTAQ